MVSRIFNEKYRFLVIGTLLLLGALIYSNTFHSSFHFDDFRSITDNPAIKNVLNLPAIWNSWPTRFITYLSLAINYNLGRLDVFGYHLFNFLVHLCNAIMIWWLVLLTFSTPVMRGEKISRHARLIAFFASLIFIAHPIQTQAVTYVIQRATSLAALFYLLSLNLYVKSRLLQQHTHKPAASWTLYGFSLAAAAMAMFTKEMAITLPLAAMLYEYSFFKTRNEKFNWKYPLPLLATILIIPITMFLTKSVDFIGMRRILEPPVATSPLQYLLTQFKVIATYVRLVFIPVNQNLDYDYHIAKSLMELPVLASLIFLVSILAIAAKIFHKYRLISFGVFWFFLTLLPESSIIPIKDVIFEHRLYLPMAGFSIFLASGMCFIFENRPVRSMVIAMLVVTLCYSALAYRRNLIWKDEITLWNDTVHKSPNKAGPYINRGTAYSKQGNLAQAIADFSRAIEIDPNYGKAYYDRGVIYSKQGSPSQAILDYDKAIEIDPGQAQAYNNRGAAYYSKGDLSQAISDYNKAIEIDTNYAQAYINRGIVYYVMKEYDRAWMDVNRARLLGCVVNSSFIEKLKRSSGRDG